MTDAIRILISHDQAVVREGLRALFATEPGIEVVGEATDGVEAVTKARTLQPDVILLDLVMPRQDGLGAITSSLRENPKARVLVLTSFAEHEKVFPAIKAGALGDLLEDSSPQELLQAIRNVHHGEASLHPTIARKLIRELNQPPPGLKPAVDPLTERELEVLRWVARGLSNDDIAEKLVVSERTVRTRVRNILDKLHRANRTQAAVYALRCFF